MRSLYLFFLMMCFLPKAYSQSSFVKGADVGFLTGQESHGVKFFDRNGQQRECLELLKNDYQLSAIRLRVWVNPRGGHCDKNEVLAMALRAKKLGMDVMIDFHYSDSWADPGKQPIPKAWQGHSYEQMKQDLRLHTIDVLTLLKDNGVEPRWVQVGNETANGLLWDMGHIEKNPAQYAGFIAAGYDAVKEVFPKAIVIVHLDRGHKQDLYDYNLDTVLRYGGRFDMVGMSLYPYWAMKDHPELNADTIITDCMANIRHVAEKYHCDVMIVETGFEVDEQHPEVMEEGRRQLTRVVKEAQTLTNGRCRGVFYWEPQCLPGGYKLGAFGSNGAPTVIMDGFVEKEKTNNTNPNKKHSVMEVQITSENFEQLKNGQLPLVVDFWATWCGPCRMVAPIISELAEKYDGRIVVGKCDVEENEDLAAEFGIRNIPTILFFKNGALVDKLVGAVSKQKFEEKFEALL